jgi:hypothetical protein
MFDVVISKQEQEFQYLVATHPGQGVFQTQARFKEHMAFRPSGLQSQMHKKLTASIAAKHKKEAKTRLTEVDIDPEKAKEEAEKVCLPLDRILVNGFSPRSSIPRTSWKSASWRERWTRPGERFGTAAGDNWTLTTWTIRTRTIT